MNPEEVRAKNVQAMGTACGELYTDLLTEILRLHLHWQQYRALFGTSEARVDLLNRAAGFFFGLLEDTWWDSVLLHITRLTDPSVVSGKETLTLHRLPGVLRESGLATHARSLVEQTTTASKFARDWRNRRIAHRNLQLVQSPNARPLAPASRADVEGVLVLLRDIVNAIERHYFHSEGMVFDYISPAGDAEALLFQLGLARMIQDERAARLKAGEDRLEDFRRPPEI